MIESGAAHLGLPGPPAGNDWGILETRAQGLGRCGGFPQAALRVECKGGVLEGCEHGGSDIVTLSRKFSRKSDEMKYGAGEKQARICDEIGIVWAGL